MSMRTIVILLSFLMMTAPTYAAAGEYEVGEGVYGRYCVGCHGVKGDGRGPGAKLLVVKPRDFTSGTFKFKSTPTGSLPTDEDLMRTITRGLPGSSMPEYILVAEKERLAVIEYIKGFSDRWKTEKPKEPVTLPGPPDSVGSPESIDKGKGTYLGPGGCMICHGPAGDGKGPIAASLTDNWGNPVKPANFLRGVLRAGSSPKDIFRTLKTGVEGTPMPAFGGMLTDEQLWELASYLTSLREKD
ncbi:MAG: c-type cytochrome [Thermodesulfobacteriota bacterium]